MRSRRPECLQRGARTSGLRRPFPTSGPFCLRHLVYAPRRGERGRADAAVEECGGSPPSGTRRRGLTQHGQTFKRGTRPQTAAGCSASLRGRLARRARPGASACPCPRCMRAARPSTSTAIELGQHRHDCQHAGPPRAAFFSAGMAGAWWAMRDSEQNWPCGMGHGSVVLERWPVVDNMAFGSAPGGPYRLAGRKHRSSDGQTIGLASPFERAHMFSMAFRSATIVLRTTPQQAQVLWRHAGARRFAYNACVANIHALLARKDDPERGPLPWSPFDNISYFYRFKKSAAAGVAEDGTPGLPWRREVHQRVFDEGAKDCGRAMARWGAYCKARKQAKEAGRKPRRKVGRLSSRDVMAVEQLSVSSPTPSTRTSRFCARACGCHVSGYWPLARARVPYGGCFEHTKIRSARPTSRR